MPTPKLEEKFWTNPIFKDVDSFLSRITTFIDMYGAAHVAFPVKGSSKFFKAVKDKGYSISPLKADAPGFFNRNQMKKLKFYAITKAG